MHALLSNVRNSLHLQAQFFEIIFFKPLFILGLCVWCAN